MLSLLRINSDELFSRYSKTIFFLVFMDVTFEVYSSSFKTAHACVYFRISSQICACHACNGTLGHFRKPAVVCSLNPGFRLFLCLSARLCLALFPVICSWRNGSVVPQQFNFHIVVFTQKKTSLLSLRKQGTFLHQIIEV